MDKNLKRKLAVAALTATAALGGVAFPATASASTSNVQIRICNHNNAALKFYLVGYNDHGDWGGSRFWDVPANGCTTTNDYWWRTNSSVEFHYARTGTGWTWKQLYVAKAKNGSTSQFNV
ncbi:MULTISPECIES: hypothetical protein [unclassified Streptomyces]|uniref:hypothetical protein n=1 Tax=unclassified Streptomyces TaxID=2593676 RepID=UPI0038059F0A